MLYKFQIIQYIFQTLIDYFCASFHSSLIVTLIPLKSGKQHVLQVRCFKVLSLIICQAFNTSITFISIRVLIINFLECLWTQGPTHLPLSCMTPFKSFKWKDVQFIEREMCIRVLWFKSSSVTKCIHLWLIKSFTVSNTAFTRIYIHQVKMPYDNIFQVYNDKSIYSSSGNYVSMH